VQAQAQARIEKLVQPPHAVAEQQEQHEQQEQEQHEIEYIKDQKLHQASGAVSSKFYL
jgi:hypothetical protein